MSKQSLLLVDGDTRSMRVLEVSLRKAGFTVTTAVSVNDALDKLGLHAPDLIISETTFPDGDGFELRRQVRGAPAWAQIPFIFLTAEGAIENKIRGLELGVDDYLTKPIYIKEIVTRINILLQKRQRARFEERRDGRTRFAGRVADMPVVDVIQTIEISRKSGVIQFVGERGRQAAIYFRDGRVIDAEAGALQGEDAVYRLLTWSEGEFEVVFRTVRRREVIATSSQGLLMEGMRRLDEWSRLLEQLPPLTHRFEVDAGELALRLGDVPDDNNGILRLIDGKRTLIEVIDSSDIGDLECLQAISRLYFEELLHDLDHEAPARRDTGRPMPLVEVEAPTPIEDAASGPTLDDLGAGIRDTGGVEVELEVVGEEDAPGALLGGYRPSSLRLIDEAVAAAQAIEPSLFDDDNLPRPVRPPAIARAATVDTGVARTMSGALRAGASGIAEGRATFARPARSTAERRAVTTPVPAAIAEDQPSAPWRGRAKTIREPEAEDLGEGPLPPRSRAATSDSGLRMIGSLGRDRAEASGELAPYGSAPPVPLSETQRELVTILPRRITREMAIATPIDPDPEPAAPVPKPTPTAGTPIPVTPAPAAARAETVPPRVLVGSGVVRASRGPGAGALTLIGIAAILAVIAVWLRLRRGEAVEVATPLADAPTQPLPHPAPAPAPQPAPAVAPVDAGATAEAAPDAAPVQIVRPPAEPTLADPRAEPTADAKLAEAKLLMDQATTAMQEGQAALALSLVERSLKLRRTARSFLLKAQALQRLDRIDDALAAVDAAERVAPTFASVFEWRGRILWSARRKDEARVQFEKFLTLEPAGARAAQIQRLLDGPR